MDEYTTASTGFPQQQDMGQWSPFYTPDMASEEIRPAESSSTLSGLKMEHDNLPVRELLSSILELGTDTIEAVSNGSLPNLGHRSSKRVLDYIQQLDPPEPVYQPVACSSKSNLSICTSTPHNESHDNELSPFPSPRSLSPNKKHPFFSRSQLPYNGGPLKPARNLLERPQHPKIIDLTQGDRFFGKARLVYNMPPSPTSSCASASHLLYSLSDACPYLGGTKDCRQELQSIETHHADDDRTATLIANLGFEYLLISRRDRALILYLLEQTKGTGTTLQVPSMRPPLPEGIATIQTERLEFWDIGSFDYEPTRFDLRWDEFYSCLSKLRTNSYETEQLSQDRLVRTHLRPLSIQEITSWNFNLSSPDPSVPAPAASSSPPIPQRSIREFQDVLGLLEFYNIGLDSLNEQDFDHLVSLPLDECGPFLQSLESDRSWAVDDPDDERGEYQYVRKDSVVPPLLGSDFFRRSGDTNRIYKGPVESRFSRCSSSSGGVSEWDTRSTASKDVRGEISYEETCPEGLNESNEGSGGSASRPVLVRVPTDDIIAQYTEGQALRHEDTLSPCSQRIDTTTIVSNIYYHPSDADDDTDSHADDLNMKSTRSSSASNSSSIFSDHLRINSPYLFYNHTPHPTLHARYAPKTHLDDNNSLITPPPTPTPGPVLPVAPLPLDSGYAGSGGLLPVNQTHQYHHRQHLVHTGAGLPYSPLTSTEAAATYDLEKASASASVSYDQQQHLQQEQQHQISSPSPSRLRRLLFPFSTMLMNPIASQSSSSGNSSRKGSRSSTGDSTKRRKEKGRSSLQSTTTRSSSSSSSIWLRILVLVLLPVCLLGGGAGVLG